MSLVGPGSYDDYVSPNTNSRSTTNHGFGSGVDAKARYDYMENQSARTQTPSKYSR